ncbi:MAG: diguanylate cyclase [Gammaproteobacteria bacterium]|nr:diguanylate cyclase [Gammaproteobacteria bacterium]
MEINDNKSFTKKIIMDASIVVGINFIAFLIFSKIDALEWLYNYSKQHEEYEVGGIIAMFFILSISLGVFAIRRWQEGNQLLAENKLLARQDPLTDLHNRRHMVNALSAEIARSIRNQSYFSIIMIDIDFFKNINDTFGHNVGDKVICQFSDTLLELTRASDLVARWGGEEFIILCPNTNLDGTNKLAKKILHRIRNFEFDSIKHVTASIGATAYQKEDTTERLIQRVNSCLHEAKDSGRDQLVSDPDETKNMDEDDQTYQLTDELTDA